MTRPLLRLRAAATLAACASMPAAALAQRAAPADDSLRLGALEADAEHRDPRARQIALLASQSALRQRTLDAERLPTLGVNAQGQYQSDVVTLPIRLPGASAPLPPHDTYDASLVARQRLYDPTRAARREEESARLAESQARVRSSLFALRQSVADAFFSALLLQAQAAEIGSGIADLEAQRRLAAERVRQGSALASEVAALDAELLRRRQTLERIAADRGAALAVLGDLTGRAVRDADALVLPELAARVARARAGMDSLRARPEYEQFARSRERLDAQRKAVAARERPRVSAFGRAGYGRPGLDPLGRDFDQYWLAGVQLEWTPWSWGDAGREREDLAIQREIVDSEDAALRESIGRAVVASLATADRLERTLAADDEIVSLRERILHETELRFGEGVITSAELVDRETDLLAARLERATHRVELAQARARFLTILGLEVR